METNKTHCSINSFKKHVRAYQVPLKMWKCSGIELKLHEFFAVLSDKAATLKFAQIKPHDIWQLERLVMIWLRFKRRWCQVARLSLKMAIVKFYKLFFVNFVNASTLYKWLINKKNNVSFLRIVRINILFFLLIWKILYILQKAVFKYWYHRCPTLTAQPVFNYCTIKSDNLKF